jgi:hypothetical protein
MPAIGRAVCAPGEKTRRSDVVEREKAVSSRESHGHQQLSRVNKVITAFFAPKKVSEFHNTR